MGQFTNPARFWFVDKDRLALVEEVTSSSNANASGGFITVDGASSSFETIEVAKGIRIHGIGRADYFPTGTRIAESDYASTTIGPLSQIHQQFHESLVFKVISAGYEDPRNLNIELAQYFNLKYAERIKEGKKFAKRNYTSTGMITPQDF